jgi:hypothetical protein
MAYQEGPALMEHFPGQQGLLDQMGDLLEESFPSLPEGVPIQ